jgi:hypothetical protein
MRKALLTATVLAALAALPTASGAYTLGVSDQQASTFTNPLFKPLRMTAARYITPYDVIDDPVEKAKLDAWVGAAGAGGVKHVLISFEHSHRGSRATRLPSVAAYTKELRKFKAAYPHIKEISPWNEVNRAIHRQPDGSYQGQPTFKSPQRVAAYYGAARKVFSPRTHTIVGIDLLDEQNVGHAIAFLRSFLRSANPDPKVIGFHNYSDTNRFSLTRTRKVLAAFRGKVWLTETGGIVKLGSSFPRSTSRAKRALGCMFTLAKSNRRIQRLYVYQFNPPANPLTAQFDAGLINPDQTKRPGYTVVQQRKAARCHS